MIPSDEVKLVVGEGELAIRLKKRWVTRHGLVQKINGLQQIRPARRKHCRQVQRLRTTVEIECRDIRGGLALDCGLFAGGKLRLKLIGDSLGDLTLDSEDVSWVAIVCLRPKMRIIVRIDQLGVDPHFATATLD